MVGVGGARLGGVLCEDSSKVKCSKMVSVVMHERTVEICKDFFIDLQCTWLPSTRLLKVGFQRFRGVGGWGGVGRINVRTAQG